MVGVGDLNRDHHEDLVIVTAQNTAILLGKGNGSFTQVGTLQTGLGLGTAVNFGSGIIPSALYVGDLNHDGNPDIALTSSSSTQEVAVYNGNGNGTFTSPKIFNLASVFNSFGQWSIFGDFNRDGHLDVLSASISAGYTIAYGNSSGGFTAAPITQTPNPGSIAKGDFNRDGIEDVAVVDEPLCATCGASVRIFRGTGKGYLQAPTTYSIPVSKGMIAVGDVNGDGKLDVVVARNPQLINSGGASNSSAPDLAVLLGRGDGTLEPAQGYHLLGAPASTTFSSSAYLIDVNHDGKLDLVGDWGTALGEGIAFRNAGQHRRARSWRLHWRRYARPCDRHQHVFLGISELHHTLLHRYTLRKRQWLISNHQPAIGGRRDRQRQHRQS